MNSTATTNGNQTKTFNTRKSRFNHLLGIVLCTQKTNTRCNRNNQERTAKDDDKFV